MIILQLFGVPPLRGLVISAAFELATVSLPTAQGSAPAGSTEPRDDHVSDGRVVVLVGAVDGDEGVDGENVDLLSIMNAVRLSISRSLRITLPERRSDVAILNR